MYELRGASVAQRVTLAALAGTWTAGACWLLLGGGLEALGGWLGVAWRPGDAPRRSSLAAGISIYYLRILLTEFVFLKRGIGWSEVFTIVPWLFGIFLLLAIAGGTNPAPFAAVGVFGLVLFLLGSWMNTYAEYERNQWKRLPENRGKLYTEGLFRYSRHPNYLGDLILFTGLCLVSGSWVTVIAPLLMLAGFIFVNIPVLDSHLHDRYGPAFDEYASHTRKLIPGLY